MCPTKKLTTEEEWDKVWEEHSLPQIFKTQCNPYYVDILDDFFHKYLPYDNNLEFLEFGCAPGKWLHYFHAEFGYRVSGLDNSQTGLEMTRKNLEILGVESALYSGDVLSYKFDKKFDVIFSDGLVEHFDPPTHIIQKHLQALKTKGYLIIAVPNIKKAVYGPLQKLVHRVNPAGYIHISAKELYSYLDKKMEVIFCDYVGVFNLYLLNIPSEKLCLPKIITFTQTVIDKLLKTFEIKKETKLFSPYILIIAKKYD